MMVSVKMTHKGVSFEDKVSETKGRLRKKMTQDAAFSLLEKS
jgi:hypothetical protein